MRIGILEAGDLPNDYKNRFGSFGEWFEPFLASKNDNLTSENYQVWNNTLPSDQKSCDGWLLTGSTHSVLEDLDWLHELRSFAVAAAQHRPVVGICFGHQLLHQAFGGSVENATGGWCVGVHKYNVIEESARWMMPSMKRLDLIASHEDQVVEPAPNSQILMTSESCPIACATIGHNILTMQPHPELLPIVAKEVFDSRRDVQGEAITNAALNSLENHVHADIASQWIGNFFRSRIESDA